jgi:hypothetical protein
MRPYKRDGAEFAQAAFRWVLSNAKRALVVNMVSKVVPHDELMAAAEDMVARIRNDRRPVNRLRNPSLRLSDARWTNS